MNIIPISVSSVYGVTNMAVNKTNQVKTSPMAQLSESIRSYVSPDFYSTDTVSNLPLVKDFNSHGGEDTKRLYAIAFDLDTTTLQQSYHTSSYNNAYADIRARLVANHGFAWQQGSVYFGGDTVNAVTCVVAVIDLTNTFPWFAASVRDIRMLRIEENNDLRPAIEQALATLQAATLKQAKPEPTA